MPLLKGSVCWRHLENWLWKGQHWGTGSIIGQMKLWVTDKFHLTLL